LSVARASIVCDPTSVASHSQTHCRQVSRSGTAASVASFQGPLSTRTSTASMPLCCAHATPATGTFPAFTCEPAAGTSILDSVLIGACCAQPFWYQ